MTDKLFHLSQLRREPIYAILGEEQSCGRSNIEVADLLLANGVRVLQYRDKKKSMKDKYYEGLLLRELTYRYNATFIVNDSLDLAIALQADGIHVGQKDLPVEVLTRLKPTPMLLGLSINREDQLKEAVRRQIVDYIGVGPFFKTSTKLDAEPLITAALKEEALKMEAHLPCVPIGGITRDNLKSLKKSGFKRAAMISELVGADDIGTRIKEIQSIWE